MTVSVSIGLVAKKNQDKGNKDQIKDHVIVYLVDDKDRRTPEKILYDSKYSPE